MDYTCGLHLLDIIRRPLSLGKAVGWRRLTDIFIQDEFIKLSFAETPIKSNIKVSLIWFDLVSSDYPH